MSLLKSTLLVLGSYVFWLIGLVALLFAYLGFTETERWFLATLFTLIGVTSIYSAYQLMERGLRIRLRFWTGDSDG